jgi:DNA polymerase-1
MTESKGLPTDIDFAVDLESKLHKQVKEIEGRLRATPEVKKYTARFGSFSPTNSDHVLRLMRDVCDRDETRKADRDGKITHSSDESVLSQIPRNLVPSAHMILEHRGIEKLRSTYLAPVLSGQVISADGLIHSKYSSMVAVTGRLASFDPNIQNWPKRKHKDIRGIVHSGSGWIVAADYGQIEFRVVGMASEDSNLVKYCWTDYDVHGFWAQRMVEEYPAIKDWIVEEFEVDWAEKGLKTLRQESKNNWVFPQLFGSSLRSCAEQLHLPDSVAEALGAEFWDQFPGVKKWQAKLLKSYEKNLYVETMSGRRRRGPMTPNEIINMPIQGTAADIVLEGMNALSERADLEDDIELQPSLNVHDDLSTILCDATIERKIDIIVREMCLPRFDWINVPLVVEVSVGTRWSDLKEIAKYRSDVLFGHPNPYI